MINFIGVAWKRLEKKTYAFWSDTFSTVSLMKFHDSLVQLV